MTEGKFILEASECLCLFRFIHEGFLTQLRKRQLENDDVSRIQRLLWSGSGQVGALYIYRLT